MRTDTVKTCRRHCKDQQDCNSWQKGVEIKGRLNRDWKSTVRTKYQNVKSSKSRVVRKIEYKERFRKQGELILGTQGQRTQHLLKC